MHNIDSHSNLFRCLKDITGGNKSVTGESEFEDYHQDDMMEIYTASDSTQCESPGTPSLEAQSSMVSLETILAEIIKLQKQQKEMSKNTERFNARIEEELKTIRHRINDCQSSIENFVQAIDEPNKESGSLMKSIFTKCPLIETSEEFDTINSLLGTSVNQDQLMKDLKFLGGDSPQKFISTMMNSLFSKKSHKINNIHRREHKSLLKNKTQ